MYIGEVNVVQEKLAELIKAAECLKIKGLAVPDEDPMENKEEIRQNKRSQRTDESPRPKRRRIEASDEGTKNSESNSNLEDERDGVHSSPKESENSSLHAHKNNEDDGVRNSLIQTVKQRQQASLT